MRTSTPEKAYRSKKRRIPKRSPDRSMAMADEILQYAAGLQQNSEHHIAPGVMRTLKTKELALWKSDDFRYLQGIGVSGTVNGKKVVAINARLLRVK